MKSGGTVLPIFLKADTTGKNRLQNESRACFSLCFQFLSDCGSSTTGSHEMWVRKASVVISLKKVVEDEILRGKER